MRLLIASNDGDVIDSIPDIEEYDLSKPMAITDLIAQIESAIEVAQNMGKS